MSDNDRPKRYRWLVIGALYAALVVSWVVAGHHRRQRDDEREARIAAELEAQGWTQAVERKDGELAKLAGDLAAALEKAGATPAIVTRTRTQRVEVLVPIETACPPVDAARPEPHPPGPTTTAASTAEPARLELGVQARHDLVAGLSPAGGLFVQGRQWVTLDAGDWSREVELPIEATEAAISAELRERLEPHPWPRWALRAGLHSDRGYAVGASAYPWRGRVLRRLGAWGTVETGRVSRPLLDSGYLYGYSSSSDWRAAGGVEVRW